MLTLNPGFALIVSALAILAAPRGARTWIMAGAAGVGFVLLLGREFGAAQAVAQMGLPVVFLNLDALNRIFGIAVLIVVIALAIYSGARRNVHEDAAILMLAGGTLSALFVGDLISLVAGASLAGLAAAWVVLASPVEGSERAGARLLIWQGVEGLLLLIGVALHITAGAASSVLARVDASSLSGACILAALVIRVGGPLAHVWLKDAIGHASSIGGAALSSLTTLLGVYMLARLMPAEPILIPIGMTMVAIGAFFAAAENDFRRSAAYALTAHNGIAVALIGVGSPLALAAAEGHVFSITLAFAALQMTLGAILTRTGSTNVRAMVGVAPMSPIGAALCVLAGLCVTAVPGFASYATQAVALEAVASWEQRALWTLVLALPAVLLVSLPLRFALVAYAQSVQPRPRAEAPFGMLLGAGLLVFLSVSVGLAPNWLYDLMPAMLAFNPFSLGRVSPQLELLGIAGIAYLLLRDRTAAIDVTPLDIDALYQGPLARAGTLLGVASLGLYDATKIATDALTRTLAKAVSKPMSLLDRPFAQPYAPSVCLLALAGVGFVMWLSASPN